MPLRLRHRRSQLVSFRTQNRVDDSLFALCSACGNIRLTSLLSVCVSLIVWRPLSGKMYRYPVYDPQSWFGNPVFPALQGYHGFVGWGNPVLPLMPSSFNPLPLGFQPSPQFGHAVAMAPGPYPMPGGIPEFNYRMEPPQFRPRPNFWRRGREFLYLPPP